MIVCSVSADLGVRIGGSMKRVFFLVALLSSTCANAIDHSVGLKAAKAGGAYVVSVNFLQEIEISKCAYALKIRPNLKQAKLEVVNSFPEPQSSAIRKMLETPEFKAMSDLRPVGGINAAAQELVAKGFDRNTSCGKIVALFEIKYHEARKNWLEARDNL